MKTGNGGLRPRAVNGLALLLLFMNQALFPLFSASDSSCQCRLSASRVYCCSIPITRGDPLPPGGMACYCRTTKEQKSEFRQGCRCGLEEKTDKQTPLLPTFFPTEGRYQAEELACAENPGEALPGFKNPLIKPPPAALPI